MDTTQTRTAPTCGESVFLDDELVRFGPGIVCLTGGGGKTTLLYALGQNLARRGGRVLCTTSTRIFRPAPEQSPRFLACADPARIPTLSEPGMLTAGKPAGEGHDPDHLRGYGREDLDALLERNVADWIVVEADGAARRPLKAPAEHEPVIPARTRIVIAVVGLSGVGKAFTDAHVFRPGPFAALSGLLPGETLAPAALARVIMDPAGLFKGAPPGTARLVFLNQADSPDGMRNGLALAAALCRLADMPDRKPLSGAINWLSLDGIYLGSAQEPTLSCLRLPTRG